MKYINSKHAKATIRKIKLYLTKNNKPMGYVRPCFYLKLLSSKKPRNKIMWTSTRKP